MTNPVNAGADIEKELAEKLGWSIENGSIMTRFGGTRKATRNECELYAALLAEAGERAKLEAELAKTRKQRDAAILAHDRSCITPDAPCAAIDDAEARARGLEAQLETVSSLLRQTEERCTRCKMFAGQVVTPCGLHLLVRAALSQLPTPQKL